MDRSNEINLNPQFARFTEIQKELKSMGYFCISMWNTADIKEEFINSFEDNHEPLTDEEIEDVKHKIVAEWEDGGTVDDETIRTCINDVLEDRD